MDIATVTPSERIVEIKHPATGEKLGIKVFLCYIDDIKMKRIKRKIGDENLALQKRGKHLTAEQLNQNQSRILFAAMTGWAWESVEVESKDENGETVITVDQATFHGEKPQFNEATVFKVFDELEWFKDQINEEVGETKSFF